LIKVSFPLCTNYPGNLEATSLQCVRTLTHSYVRVYISHISAHCQYETQSYRWRRLCGCDVRATRVRQATCVSVAAKL